MSLRGKHGEERRHRRHLQVVIDDLVHQHAGERCKQPRIAACGGESDDGGP
jgi:hypothetical protein